MDPRSQRNLAWFIVAGAAFVIFVRLGAPLLTGDPESEGAPSGTVLAVETVGTPSQKEAVVQLHTGKTVRAAIPPACLVFAGQTAYLRVSNPLSGDGPKYTLLRSEDNAR